MKEMMIMYFRKEARLHNTRLRHMKTQCSTEKAANKSSGIRKWGRKKRFRVNFD